MIYSNEKAFAPAFSNKWRELEMYLVTTHSHGYHPCISSLLGAVHCGVVWMKGLQLALHGEAGHEKGGQTDKLPNATM
jgi:hypothetical protein